MSKLQQIATALFANSPFTEGKPNGYLSMRRFLDDTLNFLFSCIFTCRSLLIIFIGTATSGQIPITIVLACFPLFLMTPLGKFSSSYVLHVLLLPSNFVLI